MRRRAIGRVGDGLALGILERLYRRARGNIPKQIGGAGGLGADDAHRCALRVCGEHAHDSGRDADVDAARDHRLLRFAAALRIQDLEAQSVLFENPSALTDLGDGRIPVAALTGGDLECFLCLRHGRRGAERQQRYRAAEQP